MCGGIIINWKTIPDPNHLGEVLRIGTDERVLGFKYYKNPLLPATIDGETKLYTWGNRDNKELKVPKTGWCRQESLASGKWNWLHPEPVLIPAIGGIEKGKWISFTSPLQGVLVIDSAKTARVYMLTKAATEDYMAYTGHSRMPVLEGDWAPMEAPVVG